MCICKQDLRSIYRPCLAFQTFCSPAIKLEQDETHHIQSIMPTKQSSLSALSGVAESQFSTGPVTTNITSQTGQSLDAEVLTGMTFEACLSALSAALPVIEIARVTVKMTLFPLLIEQKSLARQMSAWQKAMKASERDTAEKEKMKKLGYELKKLDRKHSAVQKEQLRIIRKQLEPHVQGCGRRRLQKRAAEGDVTGGP